MQRGHLPHGQQRLLAGRKRQGRYALNRPNNTKPQRQRHARAGCPLHALGARRAGPPGLADKPWVRMPRRLAARGAERAPFTARRCCCQPAIARHAPVAPGQRQCRHHRPTCGQAPHATAGRVAPQRTGEGHIQCCGAAKPQTMDCSWLQLPGPPMRREMLERREGAPTYVPHATSHLPKRTRHPGRRHPLPPPPCLHPTRHVLPPPYHPHAPSGQGLAAD